MDRDDNERWSEQRRRERGWGSADSGGWGWSRGDGDRERGYWPPYDDSYYDRPRTSGAREEASRWFAGNEDGPRRWTPYNAPHGYRGGSNQGAPWGERGYERPREFGRGGWGGWGDWRPWEREEPRGRGEWSEGRAGQWGETSFTGRGPRGYRRSDERIREEINDRLTDAFDVDPADVDVAVKNGEVTLRGTVTSRYAKRRIEHIADDVRGVEDVHNELRIVGAPLPPEEGVPETAVRGRSRHTRTTDVNHVNSMETARR